MMTGGVANNIGVVKELEKQLNAKIYIPENPESCGALGAAIYALNSEIQIQINRFYILFVNLLCREVYEFVFV